MLSALALLCVVQSAMSLTYNYQQGTSSCGRLMITAQGEITCDTGGSSVSVPFNFSSALFCHSGVSITASTGRVQCSQAVPQCVLAATKSIVEQSETFDLQATCTNQASEFVWIGESGATETNQSDLISKQFMAGNALGMYAYAVKGKNAAGAGNVASVVIRNGNELAPQHAYVLHDGKLAVVNIETKTISEVAVGAYPIGIAANSSGTRAYVTNQGSNTVSVVDVSTASPKVLSTIGVGLGPTGIVRNASDTQLYVTNQSAGSITVIDAITGTVTDTINLGTGTKLSGVTLSKDETRLYAADEMNNQVWVVSPIASTGSISTIKVGVTPKSVLTSENLIFVSNFGDATVTVIQDGSIPVVQDLIKVGKQPLGMDVNPEGNKVYVVNNGERTVSAIDIPTRQVTETVLVKTTPSYVSFNELGTLAFVTNGDHTISVINTAASEVIDAGEIAVPSTGGLYSFGKFVSKLEGTNYRGLWWNPAESGWGLTVDQHGGMAFVAIYSYDDAGNPVWYVMFSCPMLANECTGDLFQVSGGTAPTQAWDGTNKQVTAVGTGKLKFSDAAHGVFSYTLNGQTGSRSISRQQFRNGSASGDIDYTDLWYNPAESGWGVGISHQEDVLFMVWYDYDNAGLPVWYVASNCVQTGQGCSGDLYRVNKGKSLTQTWAGANPSVTKVGSVTLTFTNSNAGTMAYSIDGAAFSKTIERQAF